MRPGSGRFVADTTSGRRDPFIDQIDLVSNGAFGSDTVWTKGNWTIAGGVGVTDNAAASTISQAISIQPGFRYIVTFTVSGFADGTVTPVLGGTSGTARGADGTYIEIIQAGNTNSLIGFSADLNATLNIDNVTVRAA